MDVTLVLTIIGPDRPGVVERLSDAVSRRGGNWSDSRMARLAGKFAGILLVTVPSANAEDLIGAFEELRQVGLKILIERCEAAGIEDQREALRLDLVGHDRPGIVHEVAAALARRGVNLEELKTDCHSAPMSGEPLFRAEARLRVPPEIDLQELRETLESIANELMVDISLDEPGA